MPARRKTNEVKDPDAPSLKEILSDSGSSVMPTFAGVDSLAIVRLIHSVSSLGGMVTFWVDSNNQRLCFSMRLWGEARSYNLDDPSQFASISEPIVAKLAKVMQTKKLPPPPPLTLLHSPVKPDK